MLAISTCWNSSRHTDGEEMVNELLELGFDTIELSHGMPVSLLPGIQRAYKLNKMKVSTVHNFCPSPVEVMIDAPDCYEFTSPNASDRRRALDLTKKTIDTAAFFNAKLVVLHLGSVPSIPKEIGSKHLEDLAYLRGMKEFAEARLELVRQREKLGPRFLNRAAFALNELSNHAKESGVLLGAEGRSHFEQVPTEDEMFWLMGEFEQHSQIGYWHDFGHLQRKHNLGLVDHDSFLAKIKPHIFGGHVNDVQGVARDHRVPFTGQIDFPHLLRHFPSGCPLVWELSSSRKAEQIRQALTAWREVMPDRA